MSDFCGSYLTVRTPLCREREARQKADSEVERLKEERNRIGVEIRGEYLPKLKKLEANLRRAVKIAVNLSYDYADTEYDDELDQLKATINPENK